MMSGGRTDQSVLCPPEEKVAVPANQSRHALTERLRDSKVIGPKTQIRNKKVTSMHWSIRETNSFYVIWVISTTTPQNSLLPYPILC